MKKALFVTLTLSATSSLFTMQKNTFESRNSSEIFNLNSGTIICLESEIVDLLNNGTDSDQARLIDTDFYNIEQAITQNKIDDEMANVLTEQNERGLIYFALRDIDGNYNNSSNLVKNSYVKDYLRYDNHEQKISLVAQHLKNNFQKARMRALIVGCMVGSIASVTSASIVALFIYLSHYSA